MVEGLERDELGLPRLYQGPQLVGIHSAEDWGSEVATAFEEYRARRSELEAEIVAVSHTAPAMIDGSGIDEELLVRGSHRSPAGEVPRGWPECLGLDRRHVDDGAVGSGRHALALRLTDPPNPLLGRVAVNRVWHHLFGRGIVPSVDNFGAMGEPPSNPDLLDHLASSFVRDGWSVKRLIRRIVLSSTYRQSSHAEARALELDPKNDLLHHVPRRRLQGEALRDAVLAVSGGLDRRLFGPSVPLYLTSFMDGRGKPENGPLDGDGRRSVYLSVRRNFMHPLFLAFDAPTPATTIGRRSVSNVPAQALALLNDPFVHGEAERWATALLAEELTAEERVAAMFRTALARGVRDAELADALAFLEAQGALYEIDGDLWRTDVRVWKDLCHVIFNLVEFSFPG